MKSPVLSPKLKTPKSAAFLEQINSPNQNHLKYTNFSTKGIPTKIEWEYFGLCESKKSNKKKQYVKQLSRIPDATGSSQYYGEKFQSARKKEKVIKRGEEHFEAANFEVKADLK